MTTKRKLTQTTVKFTDEQLDYIDSIVEGVYYIDNFTEAVRLIVNEHRINELIDKEMEN